MSSLISEMISRNLLLTTDSTMNSCKFFSVPNVASVHVVPFGKQHSVQCMHHGLTFVIPLAPHISFAKMWMQSH